MPHPRSNETTSVPGWSIGADAQIDMGIVRMAQALSGEIHLDALVEMLMRLALEHTGAERGLLVLSHGDEYRVAAEAMSDRRPMVRVRADPVTPGELAQSVLRHVIRTRETVILKAPATDDRFAS